MSHVVHLAVEEHPPKNKNCLVVLRDVAGGYFVLSSADSYQREASPSDYPIAEAERAIAISRAQAHADSHGIDSVYVDAT